MTTISPRIVPSPILADVLSPPVWVEALLAEAGGEPADGPPVRPVASLRGDAEVQIARVVHTPHLALVTARVAGAVSLDAECFERATSGAYDAIAGVLRPLAAHHSVRFWPVRFWNAIPGLHARVGEPSLGLDRYMVFNAGRFAALERLFHSRPEVHRKVATATGVGHAGEDLVVHCLAASAPGRPVENPRQVPAYRYSRRFGPVPPCFARATVADLHDAPTTSPTVLVGGTASVRGEDSVHPGDLAAQLEETLLNLATLVSAARGEPLSGDGYAALGWFRNLRAYYVRDADAPVLLDALRRAFPRVRTLELVRADLCRADLLVEIEGVAEGNAP